MSPANSKVVSSGALVREVANDSMELSSLPPAQIDASLTHFLARQRSPMDQADQVSKEAVTDTQSLLQPLRYHRALWLTKVETLLRITYQDPNGAFRTWESAERRTRPHGAEIDGVGIVAILDKPTGGEIILQKQYRPPIGKVTIEVPAGLVDAGESAEEAAIRELREETGYIGTVTETTPIMYNDPGFCNTNLRMVHMKIDMTLPENQDPKPQLEDGEFIEVFTVKLADLWHECERLAKEGCAIDARVGTLAEGMLLAQSLKF
ncbi:hypothetical protein E4U22_006787 [Claviceps purpurea]|uniref:Related to YSA1 sugar-nucleotide hydrolase n=1 Tax=Claviceps purpurea (strain 20.1) TaxID=1111077 RepID=M1WID8_CLAP2|nr:hypothetical protein E4U38_000496 [Claviceps purpurea]CCE34304.1 related to YSA1 sugar-nucleotide hydrolase [Claviceps purpurea 20.1]KAG6142665.1 hypothetical protein E4U12_002960 [Claviceps purpurea]KAG6192394.1 hypothetical protein E4U27_003140 [Claviceps purpurea]KAG6204925.1 hypothetical protein E4U50_005006 [Claviceps purpurea]